VIDSGDVLRARRRAELLQRVTTRRAIAVTAGTAITEAARTEALTARVPWLLDGRVEPSPS
jgi:hypothetical protein